MSFDKGVYKFRLQNQHTEKSQSVARLGQQHVAPATQLLIHRLLIQCTTNLACLFHNGIQKASKFDSSPYLMFATNIWQFNLVIRNSQLAMYSKQFKPSISTSHSKPRTTSHTRLLNFFVLIRLCCKTKHLRNLIQAIVRGFE